MLRRLLDDPRTQTQRPLYLPLSTDGHVAVYGAPGTGKTVFLQTLATSICTRYSPDEANLYMMDFGGWSMGMFKDFPHVVAIANDNEEEKLTQMARSLENELLRRKELFSKEGVGNLRTYLRATGEKLPYLVLMVDNFAPVYQLYPQLEDFFIRLGREGGNYGICLVATCGTTMGLGYKLNQSIKTSIVLQMTDPSDYGSVVGRTEGLLPEKLAGRGLFRENRVLEFQTALPAQVGADGTYITAIRALGQQLTARWGKRKVDVMTVMPDVIDFDSVEAKNGGVVLGISSEELKPVESTLPDPHHLIISGLPGSGKTTLLNTIVRQLRQRDGARVALYGDPAQYSDCGEGICLLADGAQADEFLEELKDELGRRQKAKQENPDAPMTPLCLVIDGYKKFFEEISQQSVNRLRALVVAGKGLGVTLLVAENAAGLSTLAEYMEPLTMLLVKGPAVLLGGSALQHLAVETGLEATQKAAQLKPREGWLKTEQEVKRFKVMNCR